MRTHCVYGAMIAKMLQRWARRCRRRTVCYGSRGPSTIVRRKLLPIACVRSRSWAPKKTGAPRPPPPAEGVAIGSLFTAEDPRQGPFARGHDSKPRAPRRSVEVRLRMYGLL